jgi:hypothetical protein
MSQHNVNLRIYWLFYMTSHVFLVFILHGGREKKRKIRVKYEYCTLINGISFFFVFALLFVSEKLKHGAGFSWARYATWIWYHITDAISHTMDGEKGQFIVSYWAFFGTRIVLRCLLINLRWIYCVSYYVCTLLSCSCNSFKQLYQWIFRNVVKLKGKSMNLVRIWCPTKVVHL